MEHDQVARLLLIFELHLSSGDAWQQHIDECCTGADVAELVTLYRGLPLYPHPENFIERACEGIRSNMTAVYCAVAHNNPYPAQFLNEDAWNQMVLKALFVAVPLDPIIGLDERANAKLAHMLADYAKERRAASRPISPELWRCVGPHATAEHARTLLDVLASDAPLTSSRSRFSLTYQKPRTSAGKIW